MKAEYRVGLTSRYLVNTLDFMPLYEYRCAQCGNFTLHRMVEQRDRLTSCPCCAAKADRLITAPNLSLMSPLRRDAFTRNEKSRHEPSVSNRHSCGPRCGCGKPNQNAGKRSKPTVKIPKLGVLETPRKRNRPWMLGH